jgi:MFS family permease
MTVINPDKPMDTAARGMHGAHTVWLNPAPPPREAGVVQGLVLTSVQSLSVMGIILITPILPAMQLHFVETPHAAALVRVALTLPALCVFLFSPYFGSLADRISGRRMLLFAAPFYALFGTAPLYVHSLGAM